MITVIEAIRSLDKSAEVVVRNNSTDEIIWNEGTTPISVAEIDTELARLQAEYDALAYSRKREAEYPPIGDQLDMIYKDMKNGTTTHAEAVEAVKNKYEKGNPSIRSTQ